jgi:hypothetical protein
MKNDAISKRELPRLIRRIHENGSFIGTRGGHSVEISIDPAPLIDAPPILYGIKTGAAWIYDRAVSIYAAADAINHLARGARA